MLISENVDTLDRIEANRDKKSELIILSKKHQLRCPIPICHHQVIFKCGDKKIPHFAHKNKCVYTDHEPESQDHLNGKLLLEKILIKLFPNSTVEKESWIKETNQQADVLVTHKDGKRLAFEIQCSKISGHKWEERHNLYKTANIKDFWILNNELNLTANTHNKKKDVLKFCDLSKKIYLSQPESSKIISPIISNISVNYVVFLDLEKKLFKIIFGGSLNNGKSLSGSHTENISTDFISMINDELVFPRYLNWIEYNKNKIEKEIEREKKEEKEVLELKKEIKKMMEENPNVWSKQLDEKRQFKLKQLEVTKYNQSQNEQLISLGNTHFDLLIKISSFEKDFNVKTYKTYTSKESIEYDIFNENTFQGESQRCDQCLKLMYIDKNNLSWICPKCHIRIPIYLNINTLDDIEKLKQKLTINKK